MLASHRSRKRAFVSAPEGELCLWLCFPKDRADQQSIPLVTGAAIIGVHISSLKRLQQSPTSKALHDYLDKYY